MLTPVTLEVNPESVAQLPPALGRLVRFRIKILFFLTIPILFKEFCVFRFFKGTKKKLVFIFCIILKRTLIIVLPALVRGINNSFRDQLQMGNPIAPGRNAAAAVFA